MVESDGFSRYLRIVTALRRAAVGCVWLSCCIGSAEEQPDTRLADAAEIQDQAAVRTLLRQSADVNEAQVDGMTALHWAAWHDDLDMATILVAADADVDAVNRYGVMPLSLACTNGNPRMVELLLESGADPNATLRGGETVLMTAARTGKLRPVQILLSRGANVNARLRDGQTALMWAAADGHVLVVAALIEAGADFRKTLPSGFDSLMFAVREGHTDVVRVLIEAGADVNQAMQPQRRLRGSPRVGTSPLLLAVENGHFQLAVTLLEAGADPDDQRSGFTALHALTWVRKPNRGDGEDGNPPPIGSGELTSLPFVRELIGRGADVNTRLQRHSGGGLNKTGATPFLMASITADVPLMRLLAESGADPLLPNTDGCTPLMAAAGVGTRAPGEEAGTEAEVLEAVQLVLDLGGDINTVDKNGETAMHGAAYKSLPKVVTWLAANGARIDIWNQKNKRGWTPLLIAEGYRPGNFKPSAETIAALQDVMRDAGVTPAVKVEP